MKNKCPHPAECGLTGEGERARIKGKERRQGKRFALTQLWDESEALKNRHYAEWRFLLFLEDNAEYIVEKLDHDRDRNLHAAHPLSQGSRQSKTARHFSAALHARPDADHSIARLLA